jgi:hypothetical protein
MQNRPVLAALAAAALALAAPTVADADPGAQLLGVTLDSSPGALVRLDSSTLAPIGRPLAPVNASWSYLRSADGRRVALAGGGGPLRVVDTRTGSVVARIAAGSLQLMPGSWDGNARLLAVSGSQGDAVVLDLRAHRVVARRPLGGTVLSGLTNRARLVLVVGTPGRTGAPRIVVVHADGTLRQLALGPLQAGFAPSRNGAEGTSRVESPGLAVDPSGRRAAVVDGAGHLAIIDLETLRVTVHDTAGRRLASAQKHVIGWARQVEWLSSHTIAVAGVNYRAGAVEPAGLRLIDTSSWTSRLVDARASLLAATDGAAVVADGDGRGIGVRVYAATGVLRFHRLGNTSVDDLTVVGGLVYAFACNSTCVRALDPATGRVGTPLLLRHETELIG